MVIVIFTAMDLFRVHFSARSSTRLIPRRCIALLLVMLLGQSATKVGAQNLDAATDPDPTTDRLTEDNLATGTHGTLTIS